VQDSSCAIDSRIDVKVSHMQIHSAPPTFPRAFLGSAYAPVGVSTGGQAGVAGTRRRAGTTGLGRQEKCAVSLHMCRGEDAAGKRAVCNRPRRLASIILLLSLAVQSAPVGKRGVLPASAATVSTAEEDAAKFKREFDRIQQQVWG